MYLAREYEVILEQRNENILKYGLVKIPTPACIVLYNGMEKRPEVEILKLSDAFENQEVEPCLELFVKVLNINDGMNENVLNGCKTLKDYVILISKIRENYNEIGDLAKAIHKAVDYCIDADHLRSFLIRNRAEVEPMLLSEGTVEEYVLLRQFMPFFHDFMHLCNSAYHACPRSAFPPHHFECFLCFYLHLPLSYPMTLQIKH